MYPPSLRSIHFVWKCMETTKLWWTKGWMNVVFLTLLELKITHVSLSSPSFPRISSCLLTSCIPRFLQTSRDIRISMVVSWESLGRFGVDHVSCCSAWRYKEKTKTLTHWPLGDAAVILEGIFKPILQIEVIYTSRILLSYKWYRNHWWSVSIGSGNALVPSGHKPLPEPELNKNYVTIWPH